MKWPAANKTYYRVVAVDEHGKRSGPSDFTEAPRPVIYSKPVVTAKVGTEYRYPLQINHSLGALTARMQDGNQVNGYFDIEQAVFKIDQGPDWLKIDPTNGVLSGIPVISGKIEVSVAVSLYRNERVLDEKVLAWGNEKVLSTNTIEVGSAVQKFAINVD